MNRRASVAAALVSAACFGTLAVFTTLAYSAGALPLQLLTWRFALAAVLLGGYLALTRPGTLVVPLSDLGRYAAISIFGYGAASICFFFALTHASASIVAILLYTYPAMVVLVEWLLFGERPSRARWAAVGLTFAGCALVVNPFGSGSNVGITGLLLGLGAAAGYTSFTMVSHRKLEGRPRMTLMTYLFVFTSLMAAAASLLTGTSLDVSGWGPDLWLLLGGIVLFPTFVAIVLYLRALRGLGAGQAAILSTFEPVFTIALAAVVLGEKLAPIQLTGAVLVLAGVFIAERAGAPTEEMAIV